MTVFFRHGDLLVWNGGLAEVVEERGSMVRLKTAAGWDAIVPVVALIEANRDTTGGTVRKTSLLAGEVAP